MKYKKQVRQESAVERLEEDVKVYQKYVLSSILIPLLKSRVKLQEEIKKSNNPELTEAKDKLKKSQITLTNTKRNLK